MPIWDRDRQEWAGLRGERGMVSMLAIVGMILLGILVLSFVSLAQLETKIGVNQTQDVRALQAAEAGARRMARAMTDSSNTANQWLTSTQPIHNAVAVDTAGSATYTVYVCDNSTPAGGAPADCSNSNDTDNQVAIRSTGTSGGASRTVVLLVNPGQAFADTDAIRGYDSLNISGSLTVAGAYGSVHVSTSSADGADATVDLSVSAGTVVAQGMSTSGTSTGTYKTTPGGSGQSPTQHIAPRRVPNVDPKTFAKYADYFLSDDGYGYSWTSSSADLGTWCPTSGTCSPGSNGWTKYTAGGYAPGTSRVWGWQWQAGAGSTPPQWTLGNAGQGGGGTPGTFYIKGRAVLNSDVGSAASPYKVSLITTATLTISASHAYLHYDDTTTLNPKVLTNTQAIVGGDLMINGSSNFGLVGLIFVHEQMNWSGSGNVTGSMIIQDANPGACSGWAAGCDPTAPSGTTQIPGSPTITYNTLLQPPEDFNTPTSVQKWFMLLNSPS